MIERRELLKLIGLAALAVAGSSTLGACQSADDTSGEQGEAEQVDLVRSDAERIAGDPEAALRLAEALQVSGGRLYGAVATAAGEGPAGNLAISPYSVLVALALTLNGAVGETQQQLVDLYEGADVATINSGLNELTRQVAGLAGPTTKADGTDTEVVIDAANALFGQAGLGFEQGFLDTLAEHYGAGLQTVDYVGETEVARQGINAWTAEQTRDKIPEILAEGDVDPLTRLVLVNTLYLKAPWERPFQQRLTAPTRFTLLDGSDVEADLMQSDLSTLPAAVGDGWQAAQLSYAGGGLAMTVLLPAAGRFAEIEADVIDMGVGAYLEAMTPTMALVRLPRWTFRTQAPLKGPLLGLGVEDAFDPGRADLSAMTAEEELHLTAVAHEVFIAVDEEGTEAAAATAVVSGTTSAPVVELELTADRPFLFVIHDVALGTPLFLGRVTDPRS